MTAYEQRIREAAGPAETDAGLTLQARGGVRLRASGDLLRCTVADQPAYEVTLDPAAALSSHRAGAAAMPWPQPGRPGSTACWRACCAAAPRPGAGR